jgi:glucose-6-phosphate isomerase
MRPIAFDPAGLFVEGSRYRRSDFDALAPRMRQLQREIVETDPRKFQAGAAPSEKQRWGDDFYQLPRQMLENYRRHREASDLGKILHIAHRLQETVDRVVVLGTGSSTRGTRALMEGCCQPYFNELSRADRGGKPRMYFGGDHLDNDSLQGLLHLLDSSRTSPRHPIRSVRERWALIVIGQDGEALETMVAFRTLVSALREAAGESALADLVVPITDHQGRLAAFARELGCQDVLPMRGGAGEGASAFSCAGLLPAAILGINVMSLLEGAIAMTEQFLTGPPGANRVLDYAAVCHLVNQKGGLLRNFIMWAQALEAVGAWYGQLLVESLGSSARGVTSVAMGNEWNAPFPSRQHPERRHDKLMVNVTVENWRTDPLQVASSSLDSDGWVELVGKSLPEIMAHTYENTKEKRYAAGHPMVEMRLPTVDEPSLGQLMQMLMLATVVESRLIGAYSCGESDSEDIQ